MKRRKKMKRESYCKIRRVEMLLLIMLIFFFFGMSANPVWAYGNDLRLSGYVKNSSSWVISEGNANDLLKCVNILQLEPEYYFRDNIKFYGIFRAYYDAVFDLEKNGWADNFKFKKEIRTNNANTTSDAIRELYAEIRWKKLFMRFGKQQVAWGKAIGSKMLDVVNPQDMRELNQLDFEDSRIPLLTANFIYTTPWKGSSIQLLLIPDIESHYVPPAGYPFSPSAINSLQQLLDAGIVNVERSATSGIRVPQNLENMEIGVKWYQNLVDFEYSLNYFYHWSDLPGMYFNSFGPGGVLNYDLKFHRFHTLGGSFTNYFHHFFVFEDTILRGELAIHLNDRVSRTDPVDPLGTKMVNADSFNYLLALDMWPITNYYLTIQFFQFICMNYHSDYLLDAVDNTISVYFSTDFFAEQIMPNLLLAYSDDGAFWFRARCKYKHSDVWSFHIGTNLYFGGRNTKIGQFGDVDNIFAEVKYAF